MNVDPFELARAEVMVTGYSTMWYDAPYEWLAVEQEFDGPLRNPETGAESRTFRLGGKIDGIVRDLRTSRILNVERKTSSEDIAEGSIYWKRTRMNAQISTYLVGARVLGYEPDDTLYDVLGKPGIRPSAVPLVDNLGVKIVFGADGVRVRTKDGKKWRETSDTAQGYVLQIRPETVDEFRARLVETISTDPARYFVRGNVVRLEAEETEAAYDSWQQAANIREGRRANRYPRNPDACLRYGSPCSFFGVCTGESSLDDPMKFARVDNPHSELDGEVKHRLPLLTNSEMAAARACDRLHHFRYDLGYVSVDDTHAQRFGTLVHAGLEAWSLAMMQKAPELECLERALAAMNAQPKARPGLAKITAAPAAWEKVQL